MLFGIYTWSSKDLESSGRGTSAASASSSSKEGSSSGNPVLDKDPSDVTCGDLHDNGGAPQVADKIVDRVHDPQLPRSQVKDNLATAIAMTCATDKDRSYAPVDEVVDGYQRGVDYP
jgi:hypothetical protein